MKEINLKVDRILGGCFSIVAKEEILVKHLQEDGVVCSDCGESLDAYIEIIARGSKVEETPINRRFICKACYATDKYKTMSSKEPKEKT